MSSGPVRVGVLASGRGSNFEALVRKEREGFFSRARFVCLVSDVPGARALDVARDQDIAAFALSPKSFASKKEYEQEVCRVLKSHDVSLLVLAGYMRIVGPTLLESFPQAIVNIHPALLPSFPGLHGQLQALEYGVKVSGCTVHFVDAGVDTGPIIGQRVVPVVDNDTEETLSQRILEQEHALYAEAVKWVTERPYVINGRVVRFCD
jgi:phosphoribosylglycinamide formyltransferase 1